MDVIDEIHIKKDQNGKSVITLCGIEKLSNATEPEEYYSPYEGCMSIALSKFLSMKEPINSQISINPMSKLKELGGVKSPNKALKAQPSAAGDAASGAP